MNKKKMKRLTKNLMKIQIIILIQNFNLMQLCIQLLIMKLN